MIMVRLKRLNSSCSAAVFFYSLVVVYVIYTPPVLTAATPVDRAMVVRIVLFTFCDSTIVPHNTRAKSTSIILETVPSCATN